MQLDEAHADIGLVQDFIPAGNSNRPGTKLVPKFITIHNTDNDSPGANAAAHAKYLKGADARKRQVSWHFTVDDKNVYQSLPTNEVGWHAGSRKGNSSSIGIEICMHPEMEVKAAYRKAALLTALLARRLDLKVPQCIVQHHSWSGKHCPRVLRDKPGGWQDFLQMAATFAGSLTDVVTPDISLAHDDEPDDDLPPVPGLQNADDEYVNIAKAGLRIRSGPGTEFDVLSVLPFGARLFVVSRFGDWSMVAAAPDAGGDGFVHSAFLQRVT